MTGDIFAIHAEGARKLEGLKFCRINDKVINKEKQKTR